MDRSVVLYGAGSDITKILKMMKEQSIVPLCIADGNSEKWGMQIDDIPIVSPNEIMKYTSDTIIITASFFDDIYKKLCEVLGENIEKYHILVAPFLWFMLVNVEYDKRLLEYSNEYILSHEDQLYNIYNLKDSITKSILDYVIAERKQKEYMFSSYTQNRGMQFVEGYFYLNELEGKDPLTIIDIGAYIGDTISEFYERFGDRICKYYAYEPEKNNYLKLKENLQGKPYEKTVTAINKALGAGKETKIFGKSKSMFGVIDNEEDGNITEVSPLDGEQLEIQGKLVVKMDVEGLESEILKGALEYIKKYRPYMAICVYHRVEDIYEIPALLENEGCKYSYILRSGVHTHLIAVPD